MSGPDIDLELELTRLARRLRRRSVQLVSELHPDLDYGTYLFFLAICDAPGRVRGADLAEMTGVHKSTASRAVAALVCFGLVEQRPDPSDGRARLLVPTPDALKRQTAYRAAMRDRLNEFLADWDLDDLDTFISLMRRFNDSAEASG
ncbi:MAG: MarR family winged helix-turn-helix transcriptional regulator [Aeromicrobium sp.]|uniref:MarR family winged helix-turn-helix transcriptional regulator n=1 Tax=Aeromicrobium sp. TaxID=1871063 RepID=UPI0039E475FF